MTATENSLYASPLRRRAAVLRLLLLTAMILFGAGYVSSADANAHEAFLSPRMTILVTADHNRCPGPSCDHRGDVCCASGYCASIGVLPSSVHMTIIGRHIATGVGHPDMIVAALQSSLFRPPKRLIPA